MAILVVEDDEDINRLLCKILRNAGYEVKSAYSGTEAKLQIGIETPDMIILDLMLPGMRGDELTSYIRNEAKLQVPIMILSAKSGLDSKVELMTIGADDYMTKPFEPEEVLVRVMALLRRTKEQGVSTDSIREVYEYKNMILDVNGRRVMLKGKEMSLTNHEFDLLSVLIKEPDKVFAREQLYEIVWKNGYYGEDNTVNVHMSNIRKKIADIDSDNEYIKTVWGIGFKMS